MHQYKRSSELFDQAQKYIPGGVNSPVRAYKSVGGTPVFIKKCVTDLEHMFFLEL